MPETQAFPSPRLFYGWVIAVCGALVLGVTHGVVTNCYSLYIIPVSTSLGVTRDAFSICSLIINAIYAVISFASGAIYRRVDIRLTLRVAGLMLPVSYFCYSFCQSLAGFYLCSVLVGLSVSFLTFVPFTAIISNWFVEKRGLALGVCFMGSGLGGMVMNALTALLLENFGWRNTYRVTGVIMLAVLIVMLFFVIRVTPEEKGLRPLGQRGAARVPVFGPSLREAVRSSSFFALLALAMIIGLISSALVGIIAPHLCDLGYSTAFASLVATLYLGALAAAKLLLGRLYDKFGALWGTAISLLGFIIGLAGLYFSHIPWVWLLILFASLGNAASNLSYPLTTRYAFGTRSYATLYGYMMGTNFVTSSVALFLSNRIYTVSGTYNPALLLLMGCAAAGLLLLPLIRPVQGAKDRDEKEDPS